MYKIRLYILISLCILAILVCLVRLACLQIVNCGQYRLLIDDLRILPAKQLPTLRGKILDRCGRELAADTAQFYLHVNYELTRLLDDRFWEGSILKKQNSQTSREQAELKLQKELGPDFGRLRRIIETCSQISGENVKDIEDRIRRVNDRIWNLREYIAFRRINPTGDFRAVARQKPVPLTDVFRIDLAEMHRGYPLIELVNENDLLLAQREFAGMKDIEILPEAKRIYPYGTAACQIIGWVGPVYDDEKELFADDEYLRYLENDTIGREGLEKFCESVLRGRRGEVVYDRDNTVILYNQTQFGADVHLTLDIELQQHIEKHLADPNANPSFARPGAVVVLDVAAGDILAMVSMPVFDLNLVRQKYNDIVNAAPSPLQNRCLSEHYPPGSSIKPFILAAGLEDARITPEDIISCPYERALNGWPNCLLFSRGACHDWRWQDEGGNKARNAVRGSCNVYFSRLADRLEPASQQLWLYKFGFGRKALADFTPAASAGAESVFNLTGGLRESAGRISTKDPAGAVNSFADVPVMPKGENRWFGIGQGNLRATVLQVANAFAAVARGGILKKARLFVDEKDYFNTSQEDIHLKAQTLAVIRDGMGAVVRELGGTAYNAFKDTDFNRLDIKVYGKTGSTQNPEHAWFACFAEDGSGRAIAIAIVIEGGQAGGQDAAPLGRDIIGFCNQAGYLGKTPPTPAVPANP